MRRTQGFTLIEIMITVVIIAIIAAVAVPNYTDYITRSKFTEAHGFLSDQRVKMEQYYMDNRRYGTGATATDCGAAAPTNAKYFTYTCTSSTVAGAGSQQYVYTATGRADQGLDGIAFTINHANARATTVTGGSPMANKGYGASGTCWVLKKPALC